jgi:hypothetical protein
MSNPYVSIFKKIKHLNIAGEKKKIRLCGKFDGWDQSAENLNFFFLSSKIQYCSGEQFNTIPNLQKCFLMLLKMSILALSIDVEVILLTLCLQQNFV